MKKVLGVFGVIAMAFTAVTPAWAGPDDGKVVRARDHVDSPKTTWDSEHQTFRLVSEEGSSRLPVEQTVNWVGKGYNRSGGQNYIFDTETGGYGGVPMTSRADFLRHTTTRWYMAPSVPGSTNEPIWAGFGADPDIPTELFRDGAFSLDIVGFSGPGRMEMLNYSDDFTTERLLSSHETRYRSRWLTKAAHTHNETLFSRPGRYEVTFRTTAAASDGTLIASADTPLVWQVGGTAPEESAPGASFTDRFLASTLVDQNSSPYTFKITPHAGRDKDGDDTLTDLTLQTGKPGTVTFYVDGYYLAELPVTDGSATWSEMLGTGKTNLSAVFVPDDGKGSWATAPVTYPIGTTVTATPETSYQNTMPVPASEDPVPAFNTAAHTVTDPAVHVSVLPDEQANTITVDLHLADSGAYSSVRGGLYAPDSANPSCLIDTVTDADGAARVVLDYNLCHSTQLGIAVSPHALVNTGGTQIWSDTLVDTEPLQIESQLGADPSPRPDLTGGSEEPAPAPTEPDEGDNSGEDTPGDDDAASGSHRLLLHRGHVDIRAEESWLGGLTMALQDDTMEHSSEPLQRNLDDVALVVPETAKHTRDQAMAGHQWDFVGPSGTSFYHLGQTDDHIHIWPGMNTTAVSYEMLRNGLNLILNPAQIPEGGRYALYMKDLKGPQAPLLDSAAADYSFPMEEPTHTHVNWLFTEPGIYSLAARWEGETYGGEHPSSPPACLVFLVGEAGTQQWATHPTIHEDCTLSVNQPDEPQPDPSPAQPLPSEPSPGATSPTKPEPSEPEPSEPAPMQPGPSEPTPNPEVTPSAPKPTADPHGEHSVAPKPVPNAPNPQPAGTPNLTASGPAMFAPRIPSHSFAGGLQTIQSQWGQPSLSGGSTQQSGVTPAPAASDSASDQASQDPAQADSSATQAPENSSPSSASTAKAGDEAASPGKKDAHSATADSTFPWPALWAGGIALLAILFIALARSRRKN